MISDKKFSLKEFNWKEMVQKFCLQWNYFHSNVAKSFSKLRNEDDFNDVTLVGDDQQQISAHKVVLSASSDYFKTILKQNRHQHPLICIEGVSFNEMNSILNYIYHGEVNINHDEIDRFLSIAQRMKLEGLTSEVENTENDFRQQEYNSYKEDCFTPNSDFDQYVLVPEEKSMMTQKSKIIVESGEFYSIEELDAKIFEYIGKDELGRWKCLICHKQMKSRGYLKEHVEIHFDGLQFPCQECDTKLRSRNSLRDHLNKKHK